MNVEIPPVASPARDVTFDVLAGQVIGVMGRNGSGKTTLMKILARVTAPTEGCATVRGRVGALLQVGVGFPPELAGRGNIALSGAILGVSRAEVAAKQDEIVEFAEIGRFLDTPVKHYSSGMFMRLAFSVSSHPTVRTLCHSAIVLHEGQVMFTGSTSEGADFYEREVLKMVPAARIGAAALSRAGAMPASAAQ